MSGEIAPDGVLGRFTNVVDTLPDTVITTRRRDTFHRQDLHRDDPAPACNRPGSGYLATDPETALRGGKRPCKACFKPVFEYLATLETSGVKLTNGDGANIPEPKGELADRPPRREQLPTLTALTEEVLVERAPEKKMHAPAPDGTLCGRSGDFRCIEPEAVESDIEACPQCFAIEDG